ncbi:hypothetical protein NNO08_01020 [Citrobacter sp. Igbk 17]|nr:hypothetical protein [Citrobacter sp. Igbk 17]MDA8496600.1 hypothetical protein [Citrobacter sp. Igbk 17]
MEELKETQTWRDAQAEYGTGSDFQRGIQAATAALQGLAGGDAGAALAGTSAPYLANIIGHDLGLSDEAALIAHAILGGAVAGAQAGKNAAENNLMGGSEDAQAAWIRQHGIDMASCSDNPGGAVCQKAMNERDAVGLVLATGTVALLPGSAQAMWGLARGQTQELATWRRAL